jgi:undecaprenyl-diphosphatase
MEISLLNQFILGLIQGIFEWLPISSSAFISLFANNFLNINNLGDLVELALFFHMGTFIAALVYFRKEVSQLFKTLFHYKKQKPENKKIFNFILITFLISALFGFIILQLIKLASTNLDFTGRIINFLIAGLLIITAIIGFSSKQKGLKKYSDLKNSDGILLGFAQGLATLPGISRSGITTSSLLLRKFNDTTALRLSFLMSLPIVFFGNIFLNFTAFTFSGSVPWIGLLTAFVFGLLTISGLIKLSKKINFNWFVLIFAILMIIAGFVI